MKKQDEARRELLSDMSEGRAEGWRAEFGAEMKAV